ncbi:hypothetical protein EON67_06550 [archaeon]|nr:MAG: hypothetical protein EON67_06550 [archaeon]
MCACASPPTCLQMETEEERVEVMDESTAAKGDKKRAVEPSRRTTTRYMTKYERARILGTRALQLRYGRDFGGREGGGHVRTRVPVHMCCDFEAPFRSHPAPRVPVHMCVCAHAFACLHVRARMVQLQCAAHGGPSRRNGPAQDRHDGVAREQDPHHCAPLPAGRQLRGLACL